MPLATKCCLVFLSQQKLMFIFDCPSYFCDCQEANIISIESRLSSSFFLGCSVFFLEGSQQQVFDSPYSTLISRFPQGCFFPDHSDSYVTSSSGNKHNSNRIFNTDFKFFFHDSLFLFVSDRFAGLFNQLLKQLRSFLLMPPPSRFHCLNYLPVQTSFAKF